MKDFEQIVIGLNKRPEPDPEAWVELRLQMVGMARKYTNAEEADEIAQRALIKYYNRFKNGRIPIIKTPNTLRTIAKVYVSDIYKDSLRKSIRHKHLVREFAKFGLFSSEEETETTALEELRAALNELLPEEQSILREKYINNRNLKSIAALLQISYGTAATRLFRARKKLETAMREIASRKPDDQ